MNSVFGIDLGTTYSCIAHIDEHGKPVVIPNFDNNRTTPSVVLFEGDERIVGEEAKNALTTNPESVVSFIKRSMGESTYFFEHEGTQYRPEEISSFILRKLVKDAGDNLGVEVKDVVITCPAYFGINEREATKTAGEIAGLNVKAILNEPTAAAVAYGIDQNEPQVILVYDLGGGTFDITMIEVAEGKIEVIVTGGDHNLGGKDWDDAIINYLVSVFEDETGIGDILDNVETSGDLRVKAEVAKKSLTKREKTKISVQHDGDKIGVELTKEKFDEITSALLEKTIMLTHDMLGEANKKGYEKFDKILLVGGSTRMPQVEERVKQEFNVDVNTFDPDESVAKGAAIYGNNLSIRDAIAEKIADELGKDAEDININEVDDAVVQEATKEVAEDLGLRLGAVEQATKTEVINVTSKSFGIITYQKATNQHVISNLICKQSSVPAEYIQTFGTLEPNQTAIDIKIMENEYSEEMVEDITKGKEIGSMVLDLPSGLPENSPIEITSRLNESGMLEVIAVEKTDNRKIETTIQTQDVISGDELDAAKKRSKDLVIN